MRSRDRLIGEWQVRGPATSSRASSLGSGILVDDEIEWYGAHLAFLGSNGLVSVR
jgi:hypothetical protein